MLDIHFDLCSPAYSNGRLKSYVSWTPQIGEFVAFEDDPQHGNGYGYIKRIKRNTLVLEKAEPERSAKVEVLDPRERPEEPEHPFQGYCEIQGIQIDIENLAGSTRKGVDKGGKPWSVKMLNHYGEIRKSQGTDGDLLDVYVGDNPDAKWVYVIHQIRPGNHPQAGQYDEDKCMIGFNSANEAIAAYQSHYDRTDFFGSMSMLPIGKFKLWLRSKQSQGVPAQPPVQWKHKHPDHVPEEPPMTAQMSDQKLLARSVEILKTAALRQAASPKILVRNNVEFRKAIAGLLKKLGYTDFSDVLDQTDYESEIAAPFIEAWPSIVDADREELQSYNDSIKHHTKQIEEIESKLKQRPTEKGLKDLQLHQKFLDAAQEGKKNYKLGQIHLEEYTEFIHDALFESIQAFNTPWNYAPGEAPDKLNATEVVRKVIMELGGGDITEFDRREES